MVDCVEAWQKTLSNHSGLSTIFASFTSIGTDKSCPLLLCEGPHPTIETTILLPIVQLKFHLEATSVSGLLELLFCQIIDGIEPFSELFASDSFWSRGRLEKLVGIVPTRLSFDKSLMKDLPLEGLSSGDESRDFYFTLKTQALYSASARASHSTNLY